jgi:hypothetical protein
MKFLACISILLFSLTPILFSQKIKQDEVDKFTKQRRVETSNSLLKGGLRCGIYTYLRSVDTTYYLNIGGHGCAVGVVGSNDKAIFLLDNDISVSVSPTGVQSYDISDNSKYYNHQYTISRRDLDLLAKNKLKSVRRYTSEGYTDIDIPEKNSAVLMKQCSLFLTTLSGVNQ